MNNETKFEWKIKLRYDNCYDLYVNGRWVLSRGSHENILEGLKKIMDAEL